MIVAAKKDRKNRKTFAIENVNKTVIVKIAKVSNFINFCNKYSWTITNAHIDAIGDQILTNINKY